MSVYLEHFQLNKDPFDQEPDVEVFFPVAGRKTILRNMLTDIESGKLLTKLTGSEGTGKTLFCRLLEQAMDHERFQLISLEYPVGSYDNLLRTICLALGTVAIDGEDDEPPPNFDELFRQYLSQFAAEGRNLVLLIDEAENLFLATLERLLRLLCHEDVLNLQILLVGRPDLDTHLEQLTTYCSNVEMGEGYFLEAIGLEETRQYIHYRLNEAGIPGDKYLEVFTEDAIEAMFVAAQGNISLTNSFAELGMKNAYEQGRFQVDEDLIMSPQTAEEEVSEAVFQGVDFVKENKWWLLLGTIVVWILLIFFWPASETEDQSVGYGDPEEQLQIITPGQEIVVPPDPEPPDYTPRKKAVDEEAEIIVAESETREIDDQQEGSPVAIKPEEPVIPEPEPVLEVQPLVELETAFPQQEFQPENLTEQQDIIVRPEKRKKIVLVQSQQDEQTETVQSEKQPEGEEVVSTQTDSHPERDAEELYTDRLGATASWLAHGKKDGYTIQLMVLASEKAEENLKKILVDDKYFIYKNQLYILKKIYPKTLYVFFGHYPTLDTARKSRNNMPKFLRDNQPYVLSIKDALEKTKE